MPKKYRHEINENNQRIIKELITIAMLCAQQSFLNAVCMAVFYKARFLLLQKYTQRTSALQL